MRNDPEITESLRFRQVERQCILNTFHALISTPPTWECSIYAWRDQNGNVQFTSGGVKISEGTLAGKAEGHMLIGLLFCSFATPGALRVQEVLTPEQQVAARNAAAEISLRNERELREMRKRALQDLLFKEQTS